MASITVANLPYLPLHQRRGYLAVLAGAHHEKQTFLIDFLAATYVNDADLEMTYLVAFPLGWIFGTPIKRYFTQQNATLSLNDATRRQRR